MTSCGLFASATTLDTIRWKKCNESRLFVQKSVMAPANSLEKVQRKRLIYLKKNILIAIIKKDRPEILTGPEKSVTIA